MSEPFKKLSLANTKVRELEDRIAELEAEKANRTEILDSAWNTANERAIKAEAELARARVVVVLLRLAASNVLSRGRRFPPRAEWRELHTAVGGAGAWLAERGTP